MSVITETYKPSMTVGQVYARPYGSAAAPMPIGNVLELALEHKEQVIKQPDMSRLGGGTHAEVRRIEEVTVKMKLADINVVNLARATMGTLQAVAMGTVADEAHVATLGGLVRLAHIQPTAVVLKKGVTVVAAAGNYEVRPEGIYILPTATDLTAADAITVAYSYGEYAAIEALTTKAVELELTFGGLNEADEGKAVLVEIWRASQGVSKALSLINKGFGALEIEGTVLQDPTKVGAGISKYYRTRLS